MDDNMYLHAIYAFYQRYNSEVTKQKLKFILMSNAILSLRLQKGRGAEAYGFNGLDYISLCDYAKRNQCHEGIPNYTSFNSYIRESLSLIFPAEKLDVIETQIVEMSEHEVHPKMKELGLSTERRYSDFYDEVQVKDRIPLSLMSGVTFPVKKMTRPSFPEKYIILIVQKQIEEIKNLLIKYNHEVPMYDVDTFAPLEDEYNVKQLVRKYRKEVQKD